MRTALRDRLAPLVPAPELDNAVSFLRALTNGLTLSIVEHPDRWDREGVETALAIGLRGLNVRPPKRSRRAG
jgi:hypothetical protein